KGLVLLCQADLTACTEGEPAANALARNIVRYVTGWKPSPRRRAGYVGGAARKKHVQFPGLSVTSCATAVLGGDRALLVAPGEADEPEANLPPRLVPGHAAGSEHGGGGGDAATGPLWQPRRGGQGRAAVAGRALPRRAGGMGRPVPLFPLVRREAWGKVSKK